VKRYKSYLGYQQIKLAGLPPSQWAKIQGYSRFFLNPATTQGLIIGGVI